MAAETVEISASIEFDLDSLFACAPPPDFDLDPDAPFPPRSAGDAITAYGNVQGLEGHPDDPVGCLMLDGLERFLLDEDDAGGVAVEDFLVDALDADSSSSGAATSPSGGGGNGCNGEGDGAFLNGLAASPDSNWGEVRHNDGKGGVLQEKIGVEEEGEDKKRRRQLRNRDSAMKSRERRKLYVRDLELKNKYLESECRRLEYLLHCCTAENLALHQHLQKGRMAVACGAKQESAVLFMKPLLLGSLFWLTSIVYLFLAPNLLAWRPETSEMKQKARGRGPNLRQEIKGAKEVRSRELGTGSTSDLVFMRRRCKAYRTKIKVFSVSLPHAFT